MKHLHRFVRRAAAFVLAAALCVCVLAPAASAATTMGGADTTLIPAEEENCLAWLFGTSDTITMPYLNIKGKRPAAQCHAEPCGLSCGHYLHGAWLHWQLCQRQRRPAGVEGAGGGHPFLGRSQAVRVPCPSAPLTPRGDRSRPGTGKPSAGRWNR